MCALCSSKSTNSRQYQSRSRAQTCMRIRATLLERRPLRAPCPSPSRYRPAFPTIQVLVHSCPFFLCISFYNWIFLPIFLNLRIFSICFYMYICFGNLFLSCFSTYICPYNLHLFSYMYCVFAFTSVGTLPFSVPIFHFSYQTAFFIC